MERSGEEEKAAGPKRPRRCVQSKLSWSQTEAAVAADVTREESKESPEEVGGKRKRGSRSGAKTPPKKALFTDTEQLHESPGCQQVLCGVKACGQNQNKGEQENGHQNVVVKVGSGGKSAWKLKNNHCGDSSPGGKSSQKLKNKHCEDSSPGKGPNQKHSHTKQRLANGTFDARKDVDIQNQHAPKPVSDLWLDAKKSAEENARLSAGKQIHPFFTSWKATKRLSDTPEITMESRHLKYHKGKLGFYDPVHVFDAQMDKVLSLDWKNWSFMESTLLESNGCHVSESAPAVSDGSVHPLKLDTVCYKKMQADQLPAKAKSSPTDSTAGASIFPIVQDINMRFLSELKVAHANSAISLLSRCSSYTRNLDNERDSGLIEERLASYYQRCSYKLGNSLWTSKYQPENTVEVCGNSESVRVLGEWLKSWHERGSRSSNSIKHGEDYSTEDDEDSLFENESDMDEIDNGDILKNILLVTGPVGSGKSAAIYACAKEQGFEVIEVNTSDVRSGALVRQKYGDGIKSHGLNKWSAESPVSRLRNLEYKSSQSDVIEVEEYENGSFEMDSQMCDRDTAHTECSVRESISSQVANKSLILFEDADVVFDEDRGFISSILQLVKTTKRPIILTCNNKTPTLSRLLDQLVLAFDLPSSAELFSHISMVCATEKAQVSPKLLWQLVISCLGDIRRTLLLIQFWCQGNASKVDRNVECTYSPLQFDIDAVHMVIPKVIPWDFPCGLSEKVAEEIRKAISAAEERLLFVETSNKRDFKPMGMPGSSKLGSNVVDTVKTRKTRRLKSRKNKRPKMCSCFEEVSAHIDLEDFSDASDSPVTHTHRTVKQRRLAVISSQSDDELPTGDLATTFMMSVDPNSNILPGMSLVQISNVQNLSERPIDSIEQLRRDNTVDYQFEGLGTASTSHICDTFKLQDVSCVPESSFVSGSENNEDGCLSVCVSANNTTVSLADFSRSICDLQGPDPNKLDRDIIKPSKYSRQHAGSAYGIDVESVHENKEPGYSQNEGEEPQSSGYPVMDECSRADFSMHMVPGEEPQTIKCSFQVDLVPETWRKLLSEREKLKPYVASNLTDASLILKLASGMSDLMSETDVMFSGCNPHLSDVLEPRMTPCSEPDAFSWYDNQCEIGSTFSQHGLCLYTNKCAAAGSILGYQSTINLAQEIVDSSMNIMTLGKLLINENSYVGEVQSSRYDVSLLRELESDLHNAVLPIIPARSSMTLKGLAFHEYLSFMSQISKLESSRLSRCMNEKQQRRSRTSQHYLSSGKLPLSPEHEALLARSFCFNDIIS